MALRNARTLPLKPPLLLSQERRIRPSRGGRAGLRTESSAPHTGPGPEPPSGTQLLEGSASLAFAPYSSCSVHLWATPPLPRLSRIPAGVSGNYAPLFPLNGASWFDSPSSPYSSLPPNYTENRDAQNKLTCQFPSNFCPLLLRRERWFWTGLGDQMDLGWNSASSLPCSFGHASEPHLLGVRRSRSDRVSEVPERSLPSPFLPSHLAMPSTMFQF